MQQLSHHNCLPCCRPKPQLASQISSFLSAHVRRQVTGCHPVVQQLLQLEAQARVAAQLAQAGFQARRSALLHTDPVDRPTCTDNIDCCAGSVCRQSLHMASPLQAGCY